MEAVKSVPELLEAILLELDLRTLLSSAQRVSRQWHTLIKESPALQEALFFKPMKNTDNVKRSVSPLLAEIFPAFLPSQTSDGDWEDQKEGHGGDVFDNLVFAQDDEKRSAFLRKGASWRRMLVLQPPARSMGFMHRSGAAVGRSSLSWLVLECNDGFEDREGETGDQREQHKSLPGLRMGALYDQALETRAHRSPAQFWICWFGREPSALTRMNPAARHKQYREMLEKALKRSEVVMLAGHFVRCIRTKSPHSWHIHKFDSEESQRTQRQFSTPFKMMERVTLGPRSD